MRGFSLNQIRSRRNGRHRLFQTEGQSQALQILSQFTGGLVAKLAILFKSPGNDSFELDWKVWPQLARGDGATMQNCLMDSRHTVTAEGAMAGCHFVENQAKGKQIGARVQPFSPYLFGRHIVCRPHGCAGQRQPQIRRGWRGRRSVARIGQLRAPIVGAGRFLDHFRQAEVKDPGFAVIRDKDVGRLDIAMNNAFLVCRSEPGDHLHGEIKQLTGRQRLVLLASALNQFAQRLPLEQLHHEKRLAFMFAEFVDGADVGVIENGGGPRFPFKALEGAGVMSQFGGKEFNRNPAAQLQIFGLVDDSHTAASEHLQNPVVGDLSADQTIPGRGTGLSSCWRRGWQHFGHWRDEPVSPPGDGLHEPGLFSIVLQYLANLADGGIDAVVGVEEDILAPDPLDDLVPGHQLTSLLDQEEQQFHGNPFELESPASPT